MAISSTHAALFASLPLPRGGSLLEIGEANWYDLSEIAVSRDGLAHLPKPFDTFAVAKAFYQEQFAPSRIVSIDMGGTPAALKFDLNKPVLLPTFDVVINHGTAEHVFNIAQVFETAHECCADGGLMIHESPFTGWIDHGFYCLQPTLFYDLAAANGYEIVLAALQEIKSKWTLRLDGRDHVARLTDIPNNSMLFVCFRKYGDSEFRIPMQGYYDRKLSEAGNQAWRDKR